MAAHFGHATVDHAVRLAREAGVAQLVLFHHAPTRSDDEVDAIIASLSGDAPVEVTAAAEGTTLDI